MGKNELYEQLALIWVRSLDLSEYKPGDLPRLYKEALEGIKESDKPENPRKMRVGV